MTTLKGLRPAATAAQRGHNLVGVVKHRPPLPRVAHPSQPWAFRSRREEASIFKNAEITASLRRLLQFFNPRGRRPERRIINLPAGRCPLNTQRARALT